MQTNARFACALKHWFAIKKRARDLKSTLPAVFIALKAEDTPLIAKALAGITIAYALSPIDLVPDFIPVLGYLDDIIILPVLITLTVKCIPKEVWERSKQKSAGMWTDGKPKRWYYAIPIMVVWALIAWLIIKALWH